MKTLRKYWAFVRIGAAQAASERGDLLGRSLFFVVILGVFAALWRAIAAAGMPIAAEQHQLVWYLAMTEWIVLSAPTRHLKIQEDVRRGDVAYQLARPVSFTHGQLGQCLGALAVRAPVLGVVALAWAYLFTGRWPVLSALVWFVPFGLLAAFVLAELWVALGLLSFWLSDASPLYWVTAKLLFILGGMMLPLELYPRWLQLVASLTPFPWLLSGPGSFVIHGPRGAGMLLMWQLFWALVMFGVVELLFWRATRNLQLSGG